MREWPTPRLAELFNVEKGKIGIKAATPGRYPLVTTGENHQTHSEAHFSGDAVCIPMISATGHGHASIKRLHHIQGEFAAGSILCACVANNADEVLARYAYYYLTACKEDVLIPLMQGSANVSLKVSDIAEIRIPLPPLPQQLAIVARLDALADKTRELTAHLDAIEAGADHLLALRFRDSIADAPYRLMGEVAPAVRRQVSLDPSKRYREVGTRSFGKGVFTKPDFDAAEATWQKPVWIETEDLVFSNIKAWEGAIALADESHHDCIASHRYITCVPDKKHLIGRFLLYYLLSEEGLERVGNASPGTADRNRTLSLGKLAKIEVPTPPLAAQQAFVKLQATVNALKTRHAAIREANGSLLPATLERLFAKAA